MHNSAALTRNKTNQPNQSRPKGPKGGLILGVMPEFNRDSLSFIMRCREYGDVVQTRFFYVTAYFIYHPDDIEYVLSTNARNFLKSMSLRSNFFHRLVGNGLVTSEGDFWRRQRRLAQPAFHRQRISAYGEVMVGYTNRELESWQAGETRDIHQDMMRLALQIVVKTLFNADVSRDADTVGRVLGEIVKPFSYQATLKWILDNRLPTPGHRSFHSQVAEMDKIVYKIITERRANNRDEGDLLSMLLQAQDEDGSQMSDKQLRDEMMTLFLAGHETTALALSWAWYLLANHPECEARFHQEVDEVLGGRLPSVSDLTKLKYTEMIAKEAMRLYPPAYGIGRQPIQDCEIGGYRIPAGSQVLMFPWATHRDPRFFPEPDSFRPERWTEEFVSHLPKYAYFPFGGGPRVCIGNYFAMMEIVLLMATIGQQYRLTLAPNQTVRLYPAMSLRPKDGMKVILSRR